MTETKSPSSTYFVPLKVTPDKTEEAAGTPPWAVAWIMSMVNLPVETVSKSYFGAEKEEANEP